MSQLPRWKDVFKSKLSLLGLVVAIGSAVFIIIGIVVELLGLSQATYTGIIFYLLLPICLIGGLVLVPWGLYNVRKKQQQIGHEVLPVIIDLDDKITVKKMVYLIAMTIFWIIVISIATYKGYNYTESVAFCGKVCHQIMEPEYTAYLRSPHSKVSCAECHIGEGASWYVKAKISGARQVYTSIFGTFSRPVPTPVEHLRPARETCEECHRPQLFHGKYVKLEKHFPGEATRENPAITALLINIGGENPETGEYEGIHWHVSEGNRVEYNYVDDKRQEIKKVKQILPDGQVIEYTNPEFKDDPREGKWRVMDCVDCHNRPTHIYDEPLDAIDQAIASGEISLELTDVRNVALDALQQDFTTAAEMKPAIEKKLQEYYSSNYPDLASTAQQQLAQATEALYKIAKNNVFPYMKVKFGTYTSNIGHTTSPGCFRCHTSEFESTDGQTIEQDCSKCHELLVEETPLDQIDISIKSIIDYLIY